MASLGAQVACLAVFLLIAKWKESVEAVAMDQLQDVPGERQIAQKAAILM